MDWGDVAALSVTTNVADAEPVDAGVKTTLMRHDFPALTVVPQVLVCAKLPAFAPVSAMVIPVRSALPEFVRVAICALDEAPIACDAKVSDAGERVAMGAEGGRGAVPERLMDWGDVAALSVTAKAADELPADAGVKTTLMRHDLPALTVEPQVLVCAKLPAFAPVNAMAIPVRSPLPELVRVTV